MNYGLARKKYISKMYNARFRNIDFNISFEEYCQLMVEANIQPESIGRGSGRFVLGRKNELTGVVDDGPYEVGNCRFIPFEQNVREMRDGGGIELINKTKQTCCVVGGDGLNTYQRGTQKQISSGTHNTAGKPPWKQARIINNAELVALWKSFPTIHQLWLDNNKPGYINLMKLVDTEYNLRIMVNMFRDESKFEWLTNELNKEK